MKVTYTRKGDYLLPDLYLEKGENYGRLGRYGILRLHFIAQNKPALNLYSRRNSSKGIPIPFN